MERSRSAPNSNDSSLPSRSTHYQDPDAPSQLPIRQPHTYSERSSASSGSSSGSRSDRSMDRGRGRGGFRGGRGVERKSSGSSGSSNGQRPVLRASSSRQDRTTPPFQPTEGSARVDSPVDSLKEKSSFTLNGHTISETYNPSGRTATNTPRSHTSSPSYSSHSVPTRNNYGGNTPTRQQTTQRPATRNSNMGWAYQEEHKIKVLEMPTTWWTKQVYQALSEYGNVVRIEIQRNSLDYNAWVTFK